MKLVGKVFTNKSGRVFSVLYKVNVGRYFVEFKSSGFCTEARRDSIINRTIKDPYTPTKYGVGFIGEGEYKTVTDERGKNGKQLASPSYTVWNGMMARCYNPKNGEFRSYGAVGVTVCKDWHNFQNFSKFFYNNHKEGTCLDKDLLVPNNKIYSEKFCRFVPPYINNLLIFQKNISNGHPIGVYYVKKGVRSVNEFRKPFTVEWRNRSLGTFSCPLEAHKVWQVNKADHIESTLTVYRVDSCYDLDIDKSLLRRVKLLRFQAKNGIETKIL